jgi:hypothetical protein
MLRAYMFLEKNVLTFYQKVNVFVLYRTISLIVVAWLLSACVSPKHYDSVELQTYQIPQYQLPEIGLVIWPLKQKNQQICVDGQYGGRNCFDSGDYLSPLILEQLQTSQAFTKVTPINFGFDKTAFTLRVSYRQGRLDSNWAKLGKLLFQTATIFFIPVNVEVRHTIQASLFHGSTLLFTQSYTRQSEELTTWFTYQSYQRMAIKSMLDELVVELHETSAFTVK